MTEKEQKFEQLLKEIEQACNGGENPQIPDELKKHLDELKDFEKLAEYISKRRNELEL